MIELRACLPGRLVRIIGTTLCALAVATVFMPIGAGAADSGGEAPFSNANHFLFMTDQLSNIEAPKELDYSYDVTGAPDSFQDHIDLAMTTGSDSAKNVQVNFLSGKRHRYVPEVTDTKGNPVIAVFLQHDVYTLSQQTGGSWRFFQKQIKLALQNDAKVEHLKLPYNGKQVDVTRVTIVPYAGLSAHRDDVGDSIAEHYIFDLSKDVPGTVLEIRSVVPGAGDAPDNVHKLRLSAVKPLEKNGAADGKRSGSGAPSA